MKPAAPVTRTGLLDVTVCPSQAPTLDPMSSLLADCVACVANFDIPADENSFSHPPFPRILPPAPNGGSISTIVEFKVWWKTPLISMGGRNAQYFQDRRSGQAEVRRAADDGERRRGLGHVSVPLV